MLFKYALASVLVVSVVLGLTPQPKDITYVESEVQKQADHTTMVEGVEQSSAVIGNDRVSNLKYVLAIQNSSMWSDVKQRTVMISTNPRLSQLLNESPEKLSDSDLALLKKACEDGLKCVAVDQLLVLRSATVTSDTGKVSVRKVITKITQVLTKYTREYHEDTYQYEEVSPSDDPSKVSETVTVIVEDNKELCKLKLGNDSVIMENETQSTTVNQDTQNVLSVTASTQVNKGNVATAYMPDTVTDLKKVDTSTVNPAVPSNVDVQNNNVPSLVADLGQVATPVNNLDNSFIIVPIPPENNDKPEFLNRDTTGVNGAPERKTRDHSIQDRNVTGLKPERKTINQKDDSSTTSTASAPHLDASVNTVSPKPVDDNLKITLPVNDATKTGNANGGDVNAGNVRAGYTKDGTINNGEMKVYNVNNVTVNKGTINNSGADAGITDIGALNNGPTNYGMVHDNKNNGTVLSMDKNDIQKYLMSVDQMYSTFIDGLGK